MRVVFFQFFFYEGRFGEDRDIYRSTRVRVANPKAKAGSHRKTDLKYMMLKKRKKVRLLDGARTRNQARFVAGRELS